jgi:hypothetical protein
MQHTASSPDERAEPGDERTPDARRAAEPDRRVEDHHFEHPTVAPVSRPAPAATSQW